MPVIDVNIHTSLYADYTDFVTAFLAGNSRKAMKLAKKFILHWDYQKNGEPVPLDSDDAVLKLGVEQAAAVVHTLFETFEQLNKNAKIGDVQVSFDDWDMDRFSTFDEARQQRRVSEYVPMLHEVAKLEGVDPEKPLTLYNGIVMIKAVAEKSKKIFSGGN